jgi:HAMP domain-containing protein
MNDSKKLRVLADWMDGQQVIRKDWSDSTEVQDDLRRIADEIEHLQKQVEELEEYIKDKLPMAQATAIIGLLAGGMREIVEEVEDG